MKCPRCGSYMNKTNDDSNTWYCTGCSYSWNEHGSYPLITIIVLVILAFYIFA